MELSENALHVLVTNHRYSSKNTFPHLTLIIDEQKARDERERKNGKKDFEFRMPPHLEDKAWCKQHGVRE